MAKANKTKRADFAQSQAEALRRRKEAEGIVEEPQVGSGEGEAVGQVMRFDVEQLFATLGAKTFENEMLSQQLMVARQQVVTLQNVVMDLEKKIALAGATS